MQCFESSQVVHCFVQHSRLMQILCRKKIRRCLSSPLPRVASTCVLRFFFCRKSDESKGLIYADLCPDLLSPCMDSHHVGWAALSPRDFFQARMGSWKHVETLWILTSGLLHCRDVNKPSILPYLLPSCIRIRPCKRDSTLPFLPSVSSHFCWIKIFIDFIFVGISRFFGEWIIMRLTLMGFSGNFVWPDAVLSLPWLVYGSGVCGSKSWCQGNYQPSNLSNMSYQLRIFVFGHDFPRLEWKAGSIDTVRGPIFWGAKKRRVVGWTAELTQVAPEEKDGKGA